jgi:aspartyl-tRNA synthetase
MCGALRLADAGKKAVLMGWMNRRRDLGQIIFVDLRDRSGITQVVFNHEMNAAVHDKAQALRNEFVIAVIGTARSATPTPQQHPYRRSRTVAEELRILNVSKPLPFRE